MRPHTTAPTIITVKITLMTSHGTGRHRCARAPDPGGSPSIVRVSTSQPCIRTVSPVWLKRGRPPPARPIRIHPSWPMPGGTDPSYSHDSGSGSLSPAPSGRILVSFGSIRCGPPTHSAKHWPGRLPMGGPRRRSKGANGSSPGMVEAPRFAATASVPAKRSHRASRWSLHPPSPASSPLAASPAGRPAAPTPPSRWPPAGPVGVSGAIRP